jgi:hypothetical protein
LNPSFSCMYIILAYNCSYGDEKACIKFVV